MVDHEKIEARTDELAALVQRWMDQDTAAPDVTAAEMTVMLLTVLSRQTAMSAVISDIDRETLLEGMGHSYDLVEPVVREAMEEADLEEAAGG